MQERKGRKAAIFFTTSVPISWLTNVKGIAKVIPAFHSYYVIKRHDDKENDMGRACSTNGEKKDRTLAKPRHTWIDDI
jgi:hypothetical protein